MSILSDAYKAHFETEHDIVALGRVVRSVGTAIAEHDDPDKQPIGIVALIQNHDGSITYLRKGVFVDAFEADLLQRLATASQLENTSRDYEMLYVPEKPRIVR